MLVEDIIYGYAASLGIVGRKMIIFIRAKDLNQIPMHFIDKTMFLRK